MSDIDYDDAVEVAPGVHWVGFHDEIAGLHCNPYLLIDGEEEDGVLVDPGSIPHFPIVMRKVINTFLPTKISSVVVNHQDPDVCGCLPVVEDVIEHDELKVVGHSVALWLVKHYGIRSETYAVDKHGFQLTLKSGRVLDFIHTRHLHSPGAVAMYDRETKSLFSGDLFGATSDNWDLFECPEFPLSMEKWHRSVMPPGNLLRDGLDALNGLEIDRILPQHGSVIAGDDVAVAFDFLANLDL